MTLRVTVTQNGQPHNRKVIALPSNIHLLLESANVKLGITGKRIFSTTGAEINDMLLIRDDDHLYISEGEDFCSKESNNEKWVTLNVGGKLFTTTNMTLTAKEPFSMLARMFAADSGSCSLSPSCRDASGAYLIDRSPTYFEPILNFLRHGKLILDEGVNPEGVLEEAQFFGIESILPLLEVMTKEQQSRKKDRPLTRNEVIHALVRTSHSTELRFQGVNLTGADLSKLDLRNINFKYASMSGCNLKGANLSWCNLERADLSNSKMDGAQLIGVRMLCASLEAASLRGCNFEDPAGSRANMEGVNMKCAILEGSNMAGVNLRVGTIKYANLQNCTLRGAVLAGADLEGCNMSGSDLHEANLRGANLKDTTLELMLNPLHMAQAIR